MCRWFESIRVHQSARGGHESALPAKYLKNFEMFFDGLLLWTFSTEAKCSLKHNFYMGEKTRMGIIGILAIVFCVITVILLIGVGIYLILRSPFKYPYCVTVFDVSGRRAPKAEDLIDECLNQNGISKFSRYFEEVRIWKMCCEETVRKSKLKKLRSRQYREAVDDKNMYRFKLVRKQTRYKQSNYVRTPYTVYVTYLVYSCDFTTLKERYKALSEIGFQCTLSEFHAKNQRKIMTKALREQIALRDNYTCRICGKYMPDGIGLHIDHIVPIAKGGKSIPSNLQVLCSKCNGKKSAG